MVLVILAWHTLKSSHLVSRCKISHFLLVYSYVPQEPEARVLIRWTRQLQVRVLSSIPS